MKFLSATALLGSMLVAGSAQAQIMGPFIEGPNIESQPSAVKCTDHKTMSAIMKQKDMHMLLSSSVDNVIKSVLYNEVGDVIVVNIFPNNKACTTDTMAQAYFDARIPIKPEVKEQ